MKWSGTSNGDPSFLPFSSFFPTAKVYLLLSCFFLLKCARLIQVVVVALKVAAQQHRKKAKWVISPSLLVCASEKKGLPSPGWLASASFRRMGPVVAVCGRRCHDADIDEDKHPPSRRIDSTRRWCLFATCSFHLEDCRTVSQQGSLVLETSTKVVSPWDRCLCWPLHTHLERTLRWPQRLFCWGGVVPVSLYMGTFRICLPSAFL